MKQIEKDQVNMSVYDDKNECWKYYIEESLDESQERLADAE